MSKYKDLKIASINGQGAEGCGVQRTTAEMQLWAKKVGAIVDFYSFDVKRYSRGAGHDMNIIPFKPKDISDLTKKLNDSYDIVIFMSYPHNKYDHDHCKLFYHTLYKGITKPIKVMYVHEIHKGNIDKVTYLVPMLCNADLVFHFDTDTWFSKTIDELGFQRIGDRLNKYTLWMNFDELDTYRQKYLNKKQRGLVSVTRWSSLKNISRSIEIMAHMMTDITQDCFVKGVERSIGAKFDILDRKDIFYVNPNGKMDGPGPVKVYGPVTRNEGLDAVASHMFSSSFYSLPKKHENYGNRMEYTQIEIIGVGTVPVFDKDWAENNTLNDGRKYIDIPYSAIYCDGKDNWQTAKQLLSLSMDSKERQKYLDTSYALVKSEFDAEIVIPKAIDLMLERGKKSEVLTDEEIYTKFMNKEFAADVMKLEAEGKLPVLGIGEFQEKALYYLDGAKQQLVKKYKEKNMKTKAKVDHIIKNKVKTKTLF